MEQIYMKEKPILPLLLSLALPMMFSMLVSSLYNIIDSIFVARISEEAMTALSLVFPVQNFVTSIAVGAGIGINAVIALYLGAGKRKEADKAATQGLVLNIIHGIVLTVAGVLVIRQFLALFTADSQVLEMGISYARIVLCFSVVITTAVTFEKVFQSMGKMIITMLGMMSGCIVNIILDPIMIFGLGPVPAMGIKGAAWATGIGQIVTLVMYLVFYFVLPMNVKISKKYLKLEKKLCLRIYAIGIPATLNMALPSFLVSALNGILAAYGQTYVVVLGIYYKLQTFLYLPANGIVQGMRPLISYNYGAGEHKRVQSIYRTAMIVIAGIMCAGMAVCFGAPAPLISLFTDSEQTLQIGRGALRIISLGFVVSSVSVTSAGSLEALGKGTSSLLISLLRFMVVIVPAAFLLSRIWGPVGVWHAFWIAEGIASLAAYIIYRRALKK